MSRILTVLASLLLLVACSSAPAPRQEMSDPIALLTESADNIRSVKTFRLDVTQEGPDYQIQTVYATVVFRRASAQYVAPGMMQASIRVLAAGIPITIDVFARGVEQWYRALWTGNNWLNEVFQPGFEPERLITSETGFQGALAALTGIEDRGVVTLESGVQTIHLSATAEGDQITALLGGLIAPEGTVEVDVYIDRTRRTPARFVVREFNSAYTIANSRHAADEPVVWTVDFSDIDGASTLEIPGGA